MKNNMLVGLFTALFVISFAASIFAVSLSEDVIQKLKNEGRFDQFVKTMIDARAKGIDNPAASPNKAGLSKALSPKQVYRTLVILMDFPDKPYTAGYVAGSAAAFDSILFSQGKNPSGSMRDYYFENSYGNFTLQGTVVGWYRAAHNASYYTNNCDGSHGMGPYPNNAQRLVEEAVDLADPDVDYSQYDNDGDGYVDGIFIIHAGTGYEETSNDCEIHSHQWGINSRYRDGVWINTYSIEPEESPTNAGLTPIGVFCHEFGHVLGLPDLYDTDYSSAGVGHWELMGSGSYNGQSRTPAGLSAWSKSQLGWLNLTNITSNQTNQQIPALAWNPVAYRLWRHGQTGSQYFVVENRQRTGFDAELPGDGVLIWHIDETAWGNTEEWHPLVFLEQADGRFDLQNNANKGDASDAFPNFGYALQFTDKTTPDSKDYNLASTEVAAWNISPSDSIMTADFDVYWSRPYLHLTTYAFDDATFGDGDGILEPGETIRLTFTVANDWKPATAATATLTIDDASIPITNGTSSLGTIATNGSANNNAVPYVFQVPADYVPRIDSFFIQISSNGGADVSVLPIEKNVGMPRILLVDDDNNDNLEHYYTDPLYAVRMPYDRWIKYSSGSPDSTRLDKYESVFWFTGDYRPSPLAAADVAALKGFMNHGGKLFLTGQTIAKQLSTFDPTFLANYLKTQYLSTSIIPIVVPEAGAAVLGGPDSIVIHGYSGASNQTNPDHISAVNGGIPEVHYYGSSDKAAVSYAGAYQLVFFSFGFEAIINNDPRWESRDTVFNHIMDFFGLSAQAGYPSVLALAVGPGAEMNLVDHTPEISWTYHDAGGAPQQQYRVEVGVDAEWSVAEMWDSGPVSGADTFAVYAGAPLLDGHTYFLRMQVFNGTQWSSWRMGQFRMNSVPGLPSNLTPRGMAGVASATPTLQLQNAGDNDGDVLTYSYEVYQDSLMTTLLAHAENRPSGTVTSSWVVSPPLTDDVVYFWRARSYDGYESGAWSVLAGFWVNSSNQPPTPFGLVAPVNDSLVLTIHPTFVWSPSSPGDLHDTIHYRLIYAADSLFASAKTVGGLTDTVYTLTDSIIAGSIFYWKVEGYDLFGGVTTSGQTNRFRTWIYGDANSDGGVNVGDAVFIVNYIFKSGAAPDPKRVGDANGDCAVNVGDAVYLINYIFKSGPPPVLGCG